MKTVDREPLLISKASVRALRKFALEAIRRHPELRKIVPDHDAAFASSLDKAFPAARHAQLPTDLRATLDRALEMPESLPRLWALTDLACALASGFDETGPHAEELAQIGSELAAHVHEHAHIVADDDPELIDANWCDAVLGAWRRGWPWLDELGEALAHAIEPDLELVDHVVAAAVDAAVAADDEHATFRMSSLALRLRVATGQTDLALDLVRRFHLGVTYGEVLAAFGRVPELLV